MNKNLKVSEFRDLLSACFNVLHRDYHSCVNNDERIAWFQRAFVWMSKLDNAKCKAAKEKDLAKRENLLDQFGQRSSDKFDLWQVAMKKASKQFFSVN